MNVASLELCKKLYELSGWLSTDFEYSGLNEVVYWPPEVQAKDPRPFPDIPAYDLGFLLRKLPVGCYVSKAKAHNTASTGNFRSGRYGFPITERADTPADAVTKLAIELFKQGILTKGASDER